MRTGKDQVNDQNHACSCDVLVVGSGIAGTMAALSAASQLGPGGTVLLASDGPVFSGSSFFPGTWGLGLIAPDGEQDQEDLVSTIMEVGCHVADEALVRSFVAGIQPSIDLLESWGLALKKPSGSARAQREYVPCFDHKHRLWRGIQRQPFVEAIGGRLSQSGVTTCRGWELLDLASPFQEGNEGCEQGTATFFCKSTQDFSQVRFLAAVLCTGGTSSLYPRHLTSADCRATVHALAAQVGCDLVNLEFLQFMPGLVSPVRNVVFNEKTFRFMELPEAVVKDLGGPERTRQLLDQRSWHGPFTSRLESRLIDLQIHQAGPRGLEMRPQLSEELPEFACTYFDWLQSATGTAADAPLQVAHYAHASNGGIRIDPWGATGVPGLFAAGECTGGMHGADRIGGLSSANGLVFGLRAGQAAAKFARQAAGRRDHAAAGSGASAPLPSWTRWGSDSAQEAEEQMGRLMEQHCGIIRSEEGLATAQGAIDQLLSHLQQSLQPALRPQDAALARRTRLRLETAQLMLGAALERRQSRGSHYRVDEPLTYGRNTVGRGGKACSMA